MAAIGLVRRWGFWIAGGASALVAASTGCGPTQPASGPSSSPTSSAATVTGSAKAFDQCDNSPPLATKYLGLLKDARCDYDRYPIMAGVQQMLGVECKFCHAPDPANPKEEAYALPTPKKAIANWMKMELMTSIKPADGSAFTCKSCHVDAKGKPLVKILGEPRDERTAHEWMNLVLTTKFVNAKTGEKLKCNHCHMGTLGSPTWQDKVILTDHLPAH